jgi:hypothetical protein
MQRLHAERRERALSSAFRACDQRGMNGRASHKGLTETFDRRAPREKRIQFYPVIRI